VPGGTCGTAACWKVAGKATAPKGYKFKDKSGNAAGLTFAKLQAGNTGKAQVFVKAKGAKLAIPALGLTAPVTVQLMIDDGMTTECWQTIFPISGVKVNSTTQFKATGP